MVGKTGVGVRGWSQGLGKGVEPKGWWSQSGSQSGTIVGFRIEWLIPVALDALLELEVVALAVKVLHLEQKKRRKKKKKNNVNVISLQWLYELQRIRQLGPFFFPHPLCRGTKFTSKAMRAAMEIAVPSLRGSSIDWLSINLDHRRRNAPAIHSASKFQPCHSITTDEGIFQRIQ